MAAPRWSIARWKPKARPRIDGSVESAIRASRGEVRTPLPMRSPTRMSEELPGGDDHPDERAGEGCQGIAEQDEALAPAGLVRPAARPQLQEAGDRIRRPLDHAQVEAVAAQDREQEVGQQREDHLAGDVVEQADQTQHLDVAGKRRLQRRDRRGR